MMKNLKDLNYQILFSILFIIGGFLKANAQTTVCLGSTHSYSITNNIGCGSGGTASFNGASGGTISNASSSTFSVTWTSTGTFQLRRTGVPSSGQFGCGSGTTTITGPTVTVTAAPSSPSTPSVSSNTCGNKTLTRGSPPSGVTWYWQGTNSNGFSTSNSSSTYSASNSGTYYIRSRSSGGCWGGSRGVSVSVNRTPSTPSTPSVSTLTCGEKRLSRGTPPLGVTWYWQGTNSNGTSTSNSATTYTASSSGTYYIRSRSSAGCWGGSRSVAVTVTPAVSQPPPPSVSTNTCGNKTLTRSSPWSGVTFYWQGTNSNGTSTSNSSTNYTVTSSGTYYIRARNASGCWGASRGVSVSVNPLPSQPSAFSVSTNTCGSKTLTRSGSAPSGVTWYWQGTNSNGTSTSNSSSTYSAGASGTYYLRPRNNSSQCWGTARGVSVSVNPTPPQPPSPSVSSNTCGNKTLTRSTPPSGFTYYWQTSSSGTSTTNSSSTLTASSSGTYYLRAKSNSANCWGSTRSVAVTVNQSPARPSTPSISSNSCGNKTLTRGTPPSGVTWYWQTSSTGTSTTNSSSTYTATSSGTYYIRAKNNSANCWSSIRSFSVTVNPAPSMPPPPSVTDNSCGNQTLTISSPWSGVTFYWQGTNSNGTSASEPASSPYTVTSSGTYYVRTRDNTTNCWSAARAISVTVNPLPARPPAFSVSTNTCGNKTLTRSGSAPSGVTWYWQGKSSNGTSTSNSNSTYTATSSGTYYLRARNNSTLCWGSSRGVSVTVNTIPSQPSTPSVSTNSCGNKTLTRGTPPSGFTWYWQTSSSGTSTTNSNTTYTATSSGTYYLRAKNNNANCWSSARAVSVSVNPIPGQPPAFSVSTNTCGNKTLTRSGSVPSGITWYWQGKTSNGTSTENSGITFTATSSGTYYLRPRNNSSQCWGSARGVSVTVNQNPAQPATPSVSTNTCGNKTLTRTNPPSGFTWYWQTSSSGTSTTNSGTTYTATSSGTYYLRAKNNNANCWGTARAISVTVNQTPARPSTPSVSTNSCGAKTLTRGTPPSGVTWYWQTSSTGTSTSNASSTYAAASSGTYYIRAKANGANCWSSVRSFSVTVDPGPSMPPPPSVTDNSCGNQTLTMTSPWSGVTFFWQGTNSNGTSASEPASSPYTVTSTGTYYVRTRDNTTNCWSTARAINVTVNPLPSRPPAFSVATNTCGNKTLTRSGSAPSGITWYWQGTNSNGTATSSSASTYSAGASGTYYLRPRNNSTLCWGPSRGVSVTVNQTPPQPPTPSLSTNTCGDKTLTRSTPPSGFTYYWQMSSTGTATTNSSTTFTANSSGTYYLRAKNNSASCWGTARSVSVTVTQSPATPSIPSISANSCGDKTLTRGTPPSGVTWYWQTSSTGTATTNSSSTYTATSSGTYYIRAKANGANCWSSTRSFNVTVNQGPSMPPPPSTTDNSCGNQTLTMTSPWSGVTFFWQGTNSNGTSASEPASSPYTVSSSGTYYVRTRDNTTNCWSAARAISVTVNPLPGQPSAFTVSTNTCGDKTLTRSGSAPSGITWYWQGTNSNGTSIANATNTATAGATGTYYLRPRNNTTECWGPARGVNVTVNQTPPQPPTPSVSTNTCGDKTLTRSTPPSGFTYYWQTSSTGTATTNDDASLTASNSGTYYLRAKNNNANCWGASRAISVIVTQSPATPSIPSISSNSCGDKTLTRGTPPSGVTWYWQISNTGTSTTNASLTYTATSSGTYYIRAKNNSENCWSSTRSFSVTVNQGPSMPPPPSATDNTCGNQTLTMTSPWSGVTFYWQGTNSNGTSASEPATSPYTVSSSGTYYVRTRDNTTYCWSAARAITVNVNPLPSQPTAFSVSANTCGDKTLTRSGSAPSGVTWYWQGTNSNGTSLANATNTATAGVTGTYYLRPRNNTTECWGPARGVAVTVNQQPSMPPPNINVSANTCGDKTLNITTPWSGVTFYWQFTENGTSTSNPSSSDFVVSSSGTYYIRTQDNTSNCWSGARSVAVTVNPIPDQPPVLDVSLNACGPKNIVRDFTVPNGITWYWQGTTSNGTSTENASQILIASTSGTYYLRPRNNTSLCWGPERSVDVTVTPVPEAPEISVTFNADCSQATLTSSISNALDHSSHPLVYHTLNNWSDGTNGNSITVSSSGTYWVEIISENSPCVSSKTYKTISFPNAGTLDGAKSEPLTVTTRLELSGQSGPVLRWEYTENGSAPVIVYSTDNFLDVSFTNNGTNNLTRSYHAVVSGENCEVISNTVDVTAEPIGNATVFVCVGDLLAPGMPPLANIDCPFKSLGWVDGNAGGVQEGNSIRWTTPGIFQPYTVHGPCNGEDRIDYGDVVQVYAIPDAPDLGDISVTYESDCSATITYTGSAEIQWSDGSTENTISVSSGTSQGIRAQSNGCLSASTAIPLSFPDAGTLDGGLSTVGTVSTTLVLSGNNRPVKRWEYTEGGGAPVIINSDDTEIDVEFSTCSSTGISRSYYAVIDGLGGCEVSSNNVTVTAQGLGSPSTPVTALTKANLGCNIVELSYPLADTPSEGIWIWQLTADGEDESYSGASNTFTVFEPGTYYLRHRLGCSWSGAISISVAASDLDQNCNHRPVIISYHTRNEQIEDSYISLSSRKDSIATTLNYFDGIGRGLQEIEKEYSHGGNDVITPYEYDNVGRQPIAYLPYTSASIDGSYQGNALHDNYALSDHSLFYQNESGKDESHAYAEARFESNALNRVSEQGSPGAAWQLGGATKVFEYTINTGSVNVIDFDFDQLLTGPKSLEILGELQKSLMWDEDDHESIEFADKSNHTILKRSKESDGTWAETYYIYDDFDQLRVVIPPAAVALLDTEYFTANAADRQAFLDRWAFQYRYDERRRMIEKKAPGAAKIVMVYDRWDRPVLTQDGNQRAKGKWVFTKYDHLNRAIITGLVDDYATLEADVKRKTRIDRYESYSGSGETLYTNNTEPQGTHDYLTMTYYGDYGFLSNFELNTIHGFSDYAPVFTSTDQGPFHIVPEKLATVKGKVTGTKIKVLEHGTVRYLETVTYYDSLYRVIQIVSENHLGGTDIISNQYDYVGNVRRVHSIHSNGANATTQLMEYGYDHANRLLSCDHTLNSGDKQRVYTNEFNELGELVKKQLHEATTGNYEQIVDYEYNIRGWLNSINKSGLGGDPGGPEPADLFNMELIYNTNLTNN